MKKEKKELIKILVNEDKWISSNTLSTLIGVSIRTIKKYVSELNLVTNNAIISSPVGYQVAKNKVNSLSLLLKNEQIYNPKKLIISKLLASTNQSHQLVQLDNLEYELCFSESYIRKLIKEINAEIDADDIKIIIEKKNLKLVGNDRSIRRLQAKLVYEEVQSNFIDLEILKTYFPKIDLRKLKVIIECELSNHSQYVNDFVLDSILLHFAIIIDRSKLNQSQVSSKYVSAKFINKINATFNVSLSKEDVEEIAELFGYISTQDETDQISADVKAFLKIISKYVSYEFVDEKLSERLGLHLRNFFKRAKQNNFQPNPMTELIKLRSPIIYEASYIALSDYCERNKIKLTQDEVAFVAIHIGTAIEQIRVMTSKIPVSIICPKYYDLAYELKAKLLKTFGDDIYIEQITTNIPTKFNEKNIYISILTLPPTRLHFVTISPLYTNIDVMNITKQIHIYKLERKRNKLKVILEQITDEKYFYIYNQRLDKHELLKLMYAQLKRDNFINQEFEAAITKRETLSSTAYNMVAIPHALECDAKKSVLAIAINKKVIDWSGASVKIVLLLVNKKEDIEIFIEFFTSLDRFFSDRPLQEKLSEQDNLEQFILTLTSNIK